MLPITSQDGNVIAADFGARVPQPPQPGVGIKTQVLYADQFVCMIRIAYFWGDTLIGYQHVMNDVAQA